MTISIRDRDRLYRVAQRYGVLVDYVDALGVRRRAQHEPIMQILRSLGAEIEELEDAYDAGEKKRWENWTVRSCCNRLGW